ncbi:hypothetical protein [Roseofilum casamattae]|uniref:Uncharacterized protein n=1 Tax=Roseofilum casamattae BLCC-M143 TaxID=3022442 RepID=A0ABT7BWB2_9CYAN|nr:hypothetical protein [Roseofilum casamattae]MDJ1183492.1 hypothetical protein [Roseofilum casamattae BLCC-M143]
MVDNKAMITYGLLFITPYAKDRSQVAQLLAEESVAMAEIEFQMSWAGDLEEAIAIVSNSSIHKECSKRNAYWYYISN